MLATISVAFPLIPLGFQGDSSQRAWGGALWLGVGDWGSRNKLVFLCHHAFGPLLWWLGPATTGCTEASRCSLLSKTGLFRELTTPSPSPPPTGRSCYCERHLYFSQSTTRHLGFQPVVSLVHRSHAQNAGVQFGCLLYIESLEKTWVADVITFFLQIRGRLYN